MGVREKLIACREERGWTQKDVRDQLYNLYGIDITVSYYGMIEAGARLPKLALAIAIATLFGMRVEDLFEDLIPTKCCGMGAGL